MKLQEYFLHQENKNNFIQKSILFRFSLQPTITTVPA